VSTTLAHAAGVDTDQAGGVDLDPFAATLAELGRRRSEERGQDDPRNVASNIALFLSAVYGEHERSERHGYAKRRPRPRDRVLPAWQAMYVSLERLKEADPKKRVFLAQFVTFHDMCVERGVRAPHDVPDDFGTVAGWAKAAGFSKGKFGTM